MRRMWLTMAAAVLTGHAQAQEPAACPAGRAAPPPVEFAAWGHPRPLAAAASPAAAGRRFIPIGAPRRLTLGSSAGAIYAAPPERPGARDGRAGIVAFDVAETGTYRVALSTGAWVEVVKKGKAVKSVGHEHGPNCSGIRKIVDFELSPGRYLLQLSASDRPQITAMIAPAKRKTS